MLCGIKIKLLKHILVNVSVLTVYENGVQHINTNVQSLGTFLRASIFCWSRLLKRIQRLLRFVWYIFSDGTQDLGLRSGGMVRPYSQPERIIQRRLVNSFWANKSSVKAKRLTLVVHGSVEILAPLWILPNPSRRTLHLVFGHRLLPVLRNE